MRRRELGLDLRLNHLVGEFLLIVDRALSASDAAGAPQALTKIVNAMRRNLRRRWSAREIEALTELSPSQIRRLFHKYLRASPRQWLQRERLILAQSLITQSPAALAEINALRKKFDRVLSNLLSEGVAAGEFELKDVSLAALAIGGMISWAYTWHRPEGRLPLSEMCEQMADLALQMVGVRTKVAA